MDYENNPVVIQKLNKEFFPLFKTVFEDTYRFREVDSDVWTDSEPEELLRRGHHAALYVKYSMKDKEWILLTDQLSSDLVEASLECAHIKNNLSLWRQKYIIEKPVMFIFHNQVFKDVYVMFDQLCIAGKPVEPEKYYIEDESRIKVNFSKDYVQPIESDCALIHGGQIYFNGELLYSSSYLALLGIRYSSDLISFIRAEIPNAKTYFNTIGEYGTLVMTKKGAELANE